MAAAQQLGHSRAAVLAVVEGAVVDVHPHEPVGEAPVQAAPEPLGVGEGALAVLEALVADREPLGLLDDDERRRLLAAAGDVFSPDVDQRRQRRLQR